MRPILLAAVLLAVAAAPAAALPGDEPFAPVSPPDGAVFAPDPAGIPVAFTCPVYRVFTAGEGFTIFGGPEDYGVSFATAPDLGTDGRLRSDTTVALDTGHVSNTLPAGQCAATFSAGGSSGERPNERPGTYYWQVWRICTGCEAGYETGPVLRLELRLAAKPAVRPPARAYAGFPAIVGLALDGVPDGARAVLQRQQGGRWVDVGAAFALRGAGEVIATLPRGRQTLRAVVSAGSDQVVGAERSLTVRPARNWRTSRRDDGRYTGRLSTELRVAGRGREIRDFGADVAMLCPGLVAGQTTTQIGRSFVKRIKVAPDGSFVAAASYGGDTTTLVRGKVAKGKVTGSAALSLGTCNGATRFSAAR